MAERLTLRMTPIYTQLIKVDVPPLLINGKGCPVTGKTPTATAILIMACVTSISDSPITRKAGKFRSHRLAILADRKATRYTGT